MRCAGRLSKTTWLPCAVSFSWGITGPIVLVDFSAAFSVHAGFVRVHALGALSSPSQPRLLAPTLTGLPFAAEQMEVSNLL